LFYNQVVVDVEDVKAADDWLGQFLLPNSATMGLLRLAILLILVKRSGEVLKNEF
jgi:hypothetical protein